MIDKDAAAERVQEITGLDPKEAKRAAVQSMIAAIGVWQHSGDLSVRDHLMLGPDGGKSVKPSNLVFDWTKWKEAIEATMTVGGASMFDFTVALVVGLWQLSKLATEEIKGEEAVLILTLDRTARRMGGIAMNDLLSPLNEALEREGYPTTNLAGLERLVTRLERIRVVGRDGRRVWLVEQIVAPFPVNEPGSSFTP